MKRVKTIPQFKAHKNKDDALVCLTAYTAPMAKLLSPHCDLLLVGDSLGMVVYGMDSTLGVTLDMIINHTNAVMRGKADDTLVIADLPFGSYENSPEQAFKTASKILKKTGCDGVKLEGGAYMAETIQHLTSRGIPVMGHIGLLPQSLKTEGGYKVQGRKDTDEQRLIADAQSLENAGAFAFVIEGTTQNLSEKITKAVDIPTIGIGASNTCDAQILVTEDMLGLNGENTAKFVKRYGTLANDISTAAQTYASEVRARTFPSEDHTYEASKNKS